MTYPSEPTVPVPDPNRPLDAEQEDAGYKLLELHNENKRLRKSHERLLAAAKEVLSAWENSSMGTLYSMQRAIPSVRAAIAKVEEPMKKLFDSRCFDLAKVFLEDEEGATESHANDLAACIQTGIEDWIETWRSAGDPPRRPDGALGGAQGQGS